MSTMTYDRREQDLGNIIHFEHVNVTVPDQRLATLYYIAGLGFTRDPYLMVDDANMWANGGQTQFHLPTRKAQVLRGFVDMVVPDLGALQQRLADVKDRLAGTLFGYEVRDKYVATMCPWGNHHRLFGAGPEFGDFTLGITRVEFPVPRGNAPGIAKFYREVMKTRAACNMENGAATARASVGYRQEMVFRETDAPIMPYDGHHVAVYLADFSGPHAWLRDHGLVTQESNPWQYRFNDIVDPDTGTKLFEIEHEVRSGTHPMFARPLVNRNPEQRQPTYQRGRDAFVPGMA